MNWGEVMGDLACKRMQKKVEEREADFDSICYGCDYFVGNNETCNTPQLCIEGSMNTSNGLYGRND